MKLRALIPAFTLLALTVSPLSAQEDAKKEPAAPAAPATPAAAPAAAPSPLDGMTLKEKAGYAYGVLIGTQLKSRGIDLDSAQLKKAFDDVYSGATPALNEEQLDSVMREVTEAGAKAAVESNKKYLDDNKGKEGVKTTDSGLQYEVLTAAEGPKPAKTDKVKVHYEGKLIDGSIFDSSVQRKEPITFGLDQVIPGWTEGVQLMSKGAKYRFVIPHNLAYGPEGRPGIPPFATLVFEVELLGINEPE